MGSSLTCLLLRDSFPWGVPTKFCRICSYSPRVTHIHSTSRLIYSAFCVMTQRRLEFIDVSGQSIVQSSRVKRSRTARPLKTRLTVCTETSATTNLRYVTSKKSEGLIYTAAEASIPLYPCLLY
jgi:hypothetical protein